jgi:ketosteroid isomerase-like protein
MTMPLAVRDLFQAIDAKDAARFVTYLTPDGVFRFANWPPVAGHEAVRQAVAQFFDSVQALRHRLVGTWEQDDRVFCQGEVTYTRHDGTLAGPLPFFNVFTMRDGRIAEYLIYVDATPLYVPQP